MMIAPFHKPGWRIMSFPEQLIALRKSRGLSQKSLAEKIHIHVTQVQRYENGTGQPTLDVIRRLALALSVSADALVFDDSERGPAGEDLKLLFEAVDHFSPEDKMMTKRILQGLIIQAQVQNLAKAS